MERECGDGGRMEFEAGISMSRGGGGVTEGTSLSTSLNQGWFV